MFRLISRDIAPGQSIVERAHSDWVSSVEEAKSAAQAVKFGGFRGLFVESKTQDARVTRQRIFR